MTGALKRRFSIGGVLAMILSPVLSSADTVDIDFSGRIEQAKRATVGILQVSEDIDKATKTHFSVRGSGFHLRDGYIVTARHAVERQQGGKTVIPKEISVLTPMLEEFPATLVGVNAFLDMVVYRVDIREGSSLGNASFAQEPPQSGEQLFTVGYPLGWGPAVGYGRLGNPNTFLPTAQTRLLQVDLSACSGNSGGGLFNGKGELVGMVHAIIQTETTQGERRCSRFAFAVPGPLVQRIATALIEGKNPHFPRVGINMTVVKVGTRWRVAVAKATGPARNGGMRKGDILLSIDDTEITSAAQFKNYLIERTTSGQRVTIKVRRGETEKSILVTLGES